MGDFNDEHVESFCDSYNLHNIVEAKTCFKERPKSYDLNLTNYKNNFQILCHFHKMTVTVLKTEFVKADSVQINYTDYRKV